MWDLNNKMLVEKFQLDFYTEKVSFMLKLWHFITFYFTLGAPEEQSLISGHKTYLDSKQKWQKRKSEQELEPVLMLKFSFCF